MKAALVLVAVLAGTAAADTPKSEAEQLFNEGRALQDADKFDQACAKFAESIEKDPRQMGALMSLAECNERSGKVATALVLYQHAFDFAGEANLPGARSKAKEKIAELAPDVPLVTIEHTGPILDGEKLVIDKVVIANDVKELPLDPGKHSIVLTAPRRLPWNTELEVRRADRKSLVLPVLEVPKSKIVTKRTSSRRVVGKVIAISGLGLGAVAGGLAYYARSDYKGLFEGAMPHCGAFPSVGGKPTCDDVGQSRSQRDGNLATGAGVIGVVGGAAVITGVLLWVTAPKEYSQTQVVPAINASGASISFVGRF
jgi:tetratricopeptide (TPR) repeat protein